MKQLIITLFAALLMSVSPCDAQGFLKKIGKALGGGVGNVVEQAIGKKSNNNGKVQGNPNANAANQSSYNEHEGTDYPEIDGIIYRVNMTDGFAAVRKVGDVMWHETDSVYIPDYVSYKNRRYPVRVIDPGAFSGETMTKIRLPNTLVEIGADAFKLTAKLKELILPPRVKYIRAGAFAGCGAYKVKLPYGLEVIEGTSFVGVDNMKELDIPNTVKKIQMRAFAECFGLESVKLSTGLTKIDPWVFKDCKALKSIRIPGNVTMIDQMAFDGCTSLTSVEFSEGLKEIGESAFADCKSLKDVTFPASLTTIDSRAFTECAFTSIAIPRTVKVLKDHAFEDCMKLTHVTIGVEYNDFNAVGAIFSFSRRGYKLFDEKDIYNLKNFTFVE